MHDTAIPPALAANQEKYTPQALALPTFCDVFVERKTLAVRCHIDVPPVKKLNLTVSCF